MTQPKEPRSIRLTQAHRSDIISAVMKQWEATNPAPTGGSFAEFIIGTLKNLMRVRKNAPAEMKAFKHLIERTKSVKTALEHLTEENRNLIQINASSSFHLQIKLADGNNGSLYSFKIPVEVADSLGIPYVGTEREYDDSDRTTWEGYTAVHEGGYNNRKYIEVVKFASQSYSNTLVLPRDDKTYQAYTKAQREQRKWEEERSKVREEISDYLNQFNTTKQIRDGWPELVDYLPAHLADPERVIQLPAIARSRLNERLGLA